MCHEYEYHRILTKDGLVCGSMWCGLNTDSCPNIETGDASLVLLSRSDHGWQSFDGKPGVGLNVLLVEKKGNTTNESNSAK